MTKGDKTKSCDFDHLIKGDLMMTTTTTRTVMISAMGNTWTDHWLLETALN